MTRGGIAPHRADRANATEIFQGLATGVGDARGMDPFSPRNLAGAIAWLGLAAMMFGPQGGSTALAVGLGSLLGFAVLRCLPDPEPAPRGGRRTVWVEAVIEERPEPRPAPVRRDRNAEDLKPISSAMPLVRTRRGQTW